MAVTPKYDPNEIEALRLQVNELQQKLESYRRIKNLGKLFLTGAARAVANKLATRAAAPVALGTGPKVDFFALNPNFKPYRIQLRAPQEPAAGRRLKVLHVIPVFTTGGSQQLVVDIIEGLSDRIKHEVLVRVQHPEQGYVGVPVHHCPSLRELGEFQPFLNRIRPDVVHVHYWGEWRHYEEWKWYHNVFQASLRAGCQVVENCNNPLMPYLHEGIARYVFVSEYARRTFGVAGRLNQVIYPGSNFAFFERAGTVPDPDTIGMVYRLDKDKLNDSSIDPLLKAVQRRPGTRALVVGGGYYLEAFREKVAACGLADRFTFTGYVAYDDLAAHYRQMAVFVAPVHKESFGQVTPFAMHMGIPVVAYDVGALDEILVSPDVLAPSQDSDAMADLIVSLLDDPTRRAAIGAYNRARATELFSVETMVAAYAELYASLVPADASVTAA